MDKVKVKKKLLIDVPEIQITSLLYTYYSIFVLQSEPLTAVRSASPKPVEAATRFYLTYVPAHKKESTFTFSGASLGCVHY